MIMVVVALMLWGAMALVPAWRGSDTARPVAAGLIILGTAHALALPEAEHLDVRINPAANLTDTAYVVLLVLGVAPFAAVAVAALETKNQWSRRWVAVTIATLVILLALWLIGDLSGTPVHSHYQITTPVGMAYSLVAIGYVTAAAILVAIATRDAIHAHDRDTVWPLATLHVAAVIGLGSCLATATAVLVAPQAVADNHEAVTLVWAVPTLGCLALAGLYGVVRVAKRKSHGRNDN